MKVIVVEWRGKQGKGDGDGLLEMEKAGFSPACLLMSMLGLAPLPS